MSRPAFSIGPHRALDITRIAASLAASSLALATRDFTQFSQKTARAARARQIAMYLCHVVAGLSFTHIGKMFRRDRTTVRHACAYIENGRDDQAFNVQLHSLESAMRVWSGIERPTVKAGTRR